MDFGNPEFRKKRLEAIFRQLYKCFGDKVEARFIYAASEEAVERIASSCKQLQTNAGLSEKGKSASYVRTVARNAILGALRSLKQLSQASSSNNVN